jgi:hypothetical protein
MAGDSPIGRRAMASILANSIVDHVRSEVTVKPPEYTESAPGTAWHHKYWFKLFKHFAAVTLGIDKRTE